MCYEVPWCKAQAIKAASKPYVDAENQALAQLMPFGDAFRSSYSTNTS